MIDLEKANKAFDEYVSNYDINNEKIRLKNEHTKRVQKISRNIAKSLKLNEEQQDLAELIGMLHDIGRFEQTKRYNTFSDKNSIDHADFGSNLLFSEGLIRNFLDDERYDKTIYEAVKNHNKLNIEDGLNEEEILYSKIVRDADKIDILYIFTVRKLEYFFNVDNIGKEDLSGKIYKDILEHRIIKHADKKTNMDSWLGAVSFVFDINFEESRKYIIEKDYINKIIDRIEYTNEDTKKKMKIIKEEVNKFLLEK